MKFYHAINKKPYPPGIFSQKNYPKMQYLIHSIKSYNINRWLHCMLAYLRCRTNNFLTISFQLGNGGGGPRSVSVFWPLCHLSQIFLGNVTKEKTKDSSLYHIYQFFLFSILKLIEIDHSYSSWGIYIGRYWE